MPGKGVGELSAVAVFWYDMGKNHDTDMETHGPSAAFLWHGGTPKSSKLLDSLDHVSIETHGVLGISHFEDPPDRWFTYYFDGGFP